MRVVVTGGAGYIGSVITDQLAEIGHTVFVFDNLSKGHREAVSPRATFVRGDLLDGELLTDLLAAERVEAVIHMAASSLVGESMAAPEAYYRNNVTGGLTLLDAMTRAGVGRLVFSSTAAVYGEPERQPISETDPIRPTNPYGETKATLERAMYWHYRAHGLRSVSLRYFNAAGATGTRGEQHDPETHLIPLVLRAACGATGAVNVFGDDYPTRDGTCVRDYVHVSDLATAHTGALSALERGAVQCEAFNVGSGCGYTVREVLDVAARVTGRTIPTEIRPRRPGDPAVLVASADRIGQALAWTPRLSSLDTIVESAWRWLRART